MLPEGRAYSRRFDDAIYTFFIMFTQVLLIMKTFDLDKQVYFPLFATHTYPKPNGLEI